MAGTGPFKERLANVPEENITTIEMIAKETRLTEVVTIELTAMTDEVITGTTNAVMKEIKDLNVITTMEKITGIVTMAMIVMITETKTRKKIAIINTHIGVK